MIRNRYDPVKRLLDVGVAAVALVIASPILGVTALVVLRDVGSPVLFRQQRPGRGGRPFTMVKFRTMQGDDRGGSASDAERLTATGRRLRALSLDELPELLNVLRGDMSLVGPRPLLTKYLPLYDARQARRHEVRPGLTGLAQVEGRNTVDWPRRLELDVEYVERRSFALDVRIVARTIGLVLRRSGVSQDGTATMTEFVGNGATR